MLRSDIDLEAARPGKSFAEVKTLREGEQALGRWADPSEIASAIPFWHPRGFVHHRCRPAGRQWVGGPVTIEQRFHSVGFHSARVRHARSSRGPVGRLLGLPGERLPYTTGYRSLPSSGNPILYTLRGRLPYFSHVAADGQVTLGCWAFSAEGVDYGADVLAGFNSLRSRRGGG